MRMAVIVNAVALLLAIGWLLRLTLPASQAVRVRNAFLLRRGEAKDFQWTPENAPADFGIETQAPPAVIADAVMAAGVLKIEGDWPRALALAGLLVRHARQDAPIRADLATTFRGIVAGTGYCADYVRVYMAAAQAADLFCRQWAFSFDGFGGHGHTFVEIYDRDERAWKFLDVHNNVLAVLSGGARPLAALELHQALLSAPERVEFVRAATGRLGWVYPEKLRAYYQRGAAEWYLWWGNDVVTRERTGLGSALARVSGVIGHRLNNVLGNLPPIRVLTSRTNLDAVSRMVALRRSVITACLLVLTLSLILASSLSRISGRGLG